jgi:cytochrome bd ubiquinol oxidase subunit II
MKTENELHHWARRVARIAMIAVFVCIAVVSVWTALGDARIAARWFSLPNIFFFAPVPALSALIAIVLWRATAAGHDALPFVCSCGLFFLSFSGLVISLWPYVGSESVTLWSGATAPASQEFLIIGTAFILPILVFYVAWSYWVFRGKVRNVHHYGGG